MRASVDVEHGLLSLTPWTLISHVRASRDFLTARVDLRPGVHIRRVRFPCRDVVLGFDGTERAEPLEREPSHGGPVRPRARTLDVYSDPRTTAHRVRLLERERVEGYEGVADIAEGTEVLYSPEGARWATVARGHFVVRYARDDEYAQIIRASDLGVEDLCGMRYAYVHRSAVTIRPSSSPPRRLILGGAALGETETLLDHLGIS